MNINEITVLRHRLLGSMYAKNLRKKNFKPHLAQNCWENGPSNLRHESDMALFVRVQNDTALSVCGGGGEGVKYSLTKQAFTYINSLARQ
jgi:hypothetical protein